MIAHKAEDQQATDEVDDQLDIADGSIVHQAEELEDDGQKERVAGQPDQRGIDFAGYSV